MLLTGKVIQQFKFKWLKSKLAYMKYKLIFNRKNHDVFNFMYKENVKIFNHLKPLYLLLSFNAK